MLRVLGHDVTPCSLAFAMPHFFTSILKFQPHVMSQITFDNSGIPTPLFFLVKFSGASRNSSISENSEILHT